MGASFDAMFRQVSTHRVGETKTLVSGGITPEIL
jgi:hypothetical protein